MFVAPPALTVHAYGTMNLAVACAYPFKLFEPFVAPHAMPITLATIHAVMMDFRTVYTRTISGEPANITVFVAAPLLMVEAFCAPFTHSPVRTLSAVSQWVVAWFAPLVISIVFVSFAQFCALSR